MNNIEINILLKIRNIIQGGVFASRMNIFKKHTQNVSESRVISTGVSMKDRLKLFSKNISDNNTNNNTKKPIIKNVTKKLVHSEESNNTKNENIIEDKIKEELNKKDEVKKEEIKNEKIEEKKEDIKINENKNNNNNIYDKKDEEIYQKKEKEQKEEKMEKENKINDLKSEIINEKVEEEKVDNNIEESNEIKGDINKKLIEPKNEEILSKQEIKIEQEQIEEKEPKDIKEKENKEEEKEKENELQKNLEEIEEKENQNEIIEEKESKNNETIKIEDNKENNQENKEKVEEEENNENIYEEEKEIKKDNDNIQLFTQREDNTIKVDEEKKEDNNNNKQEEIIEITNDKKETEIFNEETLKEENQAIKEKEENNNNINLDNKENINKEKEDYILNEKIKVKEKEKERAKEGIEEPKHKKRKLSKEKNYIKDEWEYDEGDYDISFTDEDYQESEENDELQIEQNIYKILNIDIAKNEEKEEIKENSKIIEKEDIKENNEELKENNNKKEEINNIENEEQKEEKEEKKEEEKEEESNEEKKEKQKEANEINIKKEDEQINEINQKEEEKSNEIQIKEDEWEILSENNDNMNQEKQLIQNEELEKQDTNMKENQNYDNKEIKEEKNEENKDNEINREESEDNSEDQNEKEQESKDITKQEKIKEKEILEQKEETKEEQEQEQEEKNKKENSEKEDKDKKSKINKKPPSDFIKRQSCLLPSTNFANSLAFMNKNLEEKKPAPKKIDANKFKMLIGQRLIGQFIKKPNELQQKNNDNEIEKSLSITDINSEIKLKKGERKSNLITAQTFTENSKLIQKDIKLEDAKFDRKFTVLEKKEPKKNIDADFEILENSTMNTSYESSLPDNKLESVNYESYLSKLKLSGKKEIQHETFCEGFFVASFPEKNGQVMENSSKFPASCGHKECSEFPSMKPEIIMRYPLVDTKNLELNNLAATICFPTGIKMCYSETEEPKQIADYVTQITNQKGERYYMRTFHYYQKMQNIDFQKKYETHPLKHFSSKYLDAMTLYKEEDFTKELTNEIQRNLDFCGEISSRDIVYIPCCLCLISKYPYISELGKCLDTIYRIIGAKKDLLTFEINDLIMYLIHSIPIPDKNMRVQFFIPYCNNPKIELQCPKIDDISIMNSNFMGLFKYLSVDNIILIFRLLLSEQKILFIHDDYTELTNIANSFISLLYPFQWIHTYIPIMSDQMLKYLETFLPFLNGIHISLMNLVENVFNEGEIEDSEEVFLIYIKKDELALSSSLKKGKNKFWKYIQSVLPPLPFEKDLKKDLKNIEACKKQLKNDVLENKIRDAFINIFVKMFYDYEKYIINLDNDVVFNKVLFMENITNKEEKIEQFYDEFIDSQLFQQFTQNIINNENSYFTKKIKEYKEKDNKNIKKSDKERNTANSLHKKDTIYLATPYLGLNNIEINNVETILDNYKIPENENKEEKVKILEDEYLIKNEDYINSRCTIFLNPERKETLKNEESIMNKEIKKVGINEKQLDTIKEEIKDIVINIFSSKIEKGENKALKKKIFSILETPTGRAFFISLISNKNNITSLQEDSFLFLEELIKGILNSVLKSEETDLLIEEIVKLILSTKFFEADLDITNKDKYNNKVHKTIFENMQKFFHGYSKITQNNLWKKWYDLELKKNRNEYSDEDDIKENVILDICKTMILFEISKSTVKNVTESINKIAFEEGSESYEQLKKQYTNLIIQAKYISQAK